MLDESDIYRKMLKSVIEYDREVEEERQGEEFDIDEFILGRMEIGVMGVVG